MPYLFEQLPLAVQLRDDATFDNFYSAGNELLVNELRRQLDGGESYLFVHGPAASGRSHLLQAACHWAGLQGKSAVYLPMAELATYPPEELFEGLEQVDLVCLDDFQCVSSKPSWQEPLFHLFNRLANRQVALLISADRSVRELVIPLADLASRLSWGGTYQLRSLDDDERLNALQFRANKRGLEISDEVAQFIMHRVQRDIARLMDVLEQLDKASLSEKRRLTIPFVKKTLAW